MFKLQMSLCVLVSCSFNLIHMDVHIKYYQNGLFYINFENNVHLLLLRKG